MKALVVAAAILAVVTAAASAQGLPNNDIGQFCRERWPGNGLMQRACISNERDSARRVNDARVSPDVWKRCRAANLKSNSYRDLETCVRTGGPPTDLFDGGAPPARTTVPVDLQSEVRKATTLKAEGYRDPGARDVCPPPLRMTERDGCQPPGRR